MYRWFDLTQARKCLSEREYRAHDVVEGKHGVWQGCGQMLMLTQWWDSRLQIKR